MNRTQFLSLFAIPFLPKVDLSEKGKCPFNVELIQKRIDYLKAHPSKVREGVTFEYEGRVYLYDKGMHDAVDRLLTKFEIGLFDVK
jgi:hypothetical protein